MFVFLFDRHVAVRMASEANKQTLQGTVE